MDFSRPEPLTISALSSIRSEELGFALYRHSVLRYGRENERFGETWRRLPKGQRISFTTQTVDMEVKNGGFNQLFWNQEVDLLQQAISDFAEISAKRHAEVLQEAIAHFSAKRRIFDRFMRIGSLLAFSRLTRKSRFSSLDDRYISLDDSLESLLAASVAANPAWYVDEVEIAS